MRMPVSLARWAALLSLLGGCACCCGNWAPIGPSPDIEAADVVGTWVSDEGAKITLNGDMTFRTDDLTKCLEGEEGVGGDGEGTWSLGDPETLDPYQDLTLKYAPYGEHLQTWRAQEDEIVYVWGDTDNSEICFFSRTG